MSRITSFKWKIDNLANVYNTKGDRRLHISRTFSLANDPNASFYLFLDGTKGYSKPGFLGIQFLASQQTGPLELNVHFWLEKGDYMFNEFVVKKQKLNFTNNTMGFRVLSTDGHMFTDIFNAKGSINLCCELENLNLAEKEDKASTSKQDLGNKLWALYEKGHNFDAIIQAGGKEFKVLSAVFMSHSEVFEQMFSVNYKEGQDKKVVIEDEVTAEAFEAFIRWMYTSEIQKKNLVEELFSLADKYMIWDLKSQCTEMMFNGLNEQNAAKRLALSLTHNQKGLETHILNYVSELSGEKIKEVFETDAWCDFLFNRRKFEKNSTLQIDKQEVKQFSETDAPRNPDS